MCWQRVCVLQLDQGGICPRVSTASIEQENKKSAQRSRTRRDVRCTSVESGVRRCDADFVIPMALRPDLLAHLMRHTGEHRARSLSVLYSISMERKWTEKPKCENSGLSQNAPYLRVWALLRSDGPCQKPDCVPGCNGSTPPGREGHEG